MTDVDLFGREIPKDKPPAKRLKVKWKEPVDIAKGLGFLVVVLVNIIIPLVISIVLVGIATYFLIKGVKLEYE